MSLLSRFRALFLGRNDDAQTTRIAWTPRTPAGVYIDADVALKVSAVWACITYLSRTVAQLPWRVMQDMGDAQPRRVSTHPVQRLLSTRPNPEMTAFAFRETMVGWAARNGNAVAEIQTDARSVPVALWPLHPSRVEFKRDEQDGMLVYEIKQDDGSLRQLRGHQVLHFRGFGEGVVGLDVISYAAESIGWARATEIFGSAYFGNGLQASGVFKFPGKLSIPTKEAFEAEIQKKHGGPKSAHKPLIVDGGWAFERMSADPDAAQFIETRQHQVEEICRWFGVPPHKVMHMLRATFSNIEHQSIEVVVDCITPWAMRLEQEADFKLFGANRQGFFTKLDLKGLLRGDYKSRQEGLQLMRRNGVISANEWRRLEDMDEIGPDGDKYIVEGNMTTLEHVGESEQPAPDTTPSETADQSAVERARQQARRALH